MNVTLVEINSETVRAVCRLTLAEGQEMFVAANAVSLAQALFSEHAWYRAIHADDELVGFVMVADDTLRAEPRAEPKIGLWRLMIDAKHQRRGIGREAIRLVLEHARSKGFREMSTSYVPGEGTPGPFYEGLGFVPTGEIDDGEVVMNYRFEGQG